MGTRNLVLVWYKGKFYIAQYGQWDGYPDGQGLVIFRFLTNRPDSYHKQVWEAVAAYHQSRGSASGIGNSNTNGDKKNINEDENRAARASAMTTCPSQDNITALKRALDAHMVFGISDAQTTEYQAEADQIQEDARTELNRGGSQCHDALQRSMQPFMFCHPSLARDCGAQILRLVAETKQPVPVQLDLKFASDSLFCEWAYVVDLDDQVLECYAWLDKEVHQGYKRLDELGDVVPSLVKRFTFEELQGMDESGFVASVRSEMEREDDEEDQGEEGEGAGSKEA